MSSRRRARGNGRFSPKTQLSAFYGLKPPFFTRFSIFFRSRSRRWYRNTVCRPLARVTRAAPLLSARISLAVITHSLVCQTQNKIISKRFTRFASFFCSVSASACLYNALCEGLIAVLTIKTAVSHETQTQKLQNIVRGLKYRAICATFSWCTARFLSRFSYAVATVQKSRLHASAFFSLKIAATSICEA